VQTVSRKHAALVIFPFALQLMRAESN